VVRTILGIGALSAIAVGASYFDPDGFVAVAEPACAGITPEGCRLRWQDVPTEEGDVEPQCVQYCPRPAAAPPPVNVVQLPPEEINVLPRPTLPGPVRGCDLTVFSDPDFQGDSENVAESEPSLNQAWDRQISSIRVQAGIWDLFTEPDYGGDTMRLGPGEYRDLGGNWDNAIGSIMCTQPGR
jgi:hypothetical protein